MDHPLEVGAQFGVDPLLWNRNWTELSGGEAQRIMLAVGVASGRAEVLLLDGESPPPPFQFLSPSLHECVGFDVVLCFGLEPLR